MTNPLNLPEPVLTDDDFARQLQQGIEQLMREMETSSTSRTDFETLVKQMSEATAPASVPGVSGTVGQAGPGQVSFSETLSRTMERMQKSETQANSARME